MNEKEVGGFSGYDRGPMSTLLIYAKHRRVKSLGRDRNVPSYARDDVTPPLGLLHLAGALRAEGFPVRVLDDSLASDREVEEAVRSHRIVGISSLTPNVPRALELLDLARGAGAVVIVGGAHASSDPPYFLERGAHYVVIGEGERTLPELLRTLEQGGDPARVKGIGWREEDGTLRFTEPRPLERDLDALPPPAWDLVDMDRYFDAMGFRVFITMATRGCPAACTFCNKIMSPRVYRKRSPEKVADEVAEYLERFRSERVYFVDDNFTCDRRWVRAFCGEVLRRGMRFEWECESRVSDVDLDLLMTMRRAGCIKIHFGVESGSPRILESINKKITPEDACRAARAARLAGIWYKFFLLLGFPWETREDLLATRRLAFRAMPDILAVSLLIPMPGSALWEQIQDRLLPDARSFEGLHYYHRKPNYRHDHLTHEELARFRDELERDYRAYYRSPRRKLRRIAEKILYSAAHPTYPWKRLGLARRHPRSP